MHTFQRILATVFLGLFWGVFLSGCATLSGEQAPERAVAYHCENGPKLVAVFRADEAVLQFHRTRATLTTTRVASGARYANPDERIVFWTKGDAAMLELHGLFWSCQAVPDTLESGLGPRDPLSG